MTPEDHLNNLIKGDLKMSERRYVLGYIVNVNHFNTDDKAQDLFEEESQVYDILQGRGEISNLIVDGKVKFNTLFTFDKNEDNEYALKTITSL